MYHQKIYCEYNNFSPAIVATMLHNISTKKYGFVNYDNIQICLSKYNSQLLKCDVLHTINVFESIPITFSEEWVQIQTILNELDGTTKFNIIATLKKYPTKLLLIFSTILSFIVTNDSKYMIISKTFNNFEPPINYYVLDNCKCNIFFTCFGGTRDYIIQFKRNNNIAKKVIDHFVTTKMDSNTNIMCISNTCVLCILYNVNCQAKFTFLSYYYESEICYISPFNDTLLPESVDYHSQTFDRWFTNIDTYTIVFHFEYDTKTEKYFNISELITKIRKSVNKIRY